MRVLTHDLHQIIHDFIAALALQFLKTSLTCRSAKRPTRKCGIYFRKCWITAFIKKVINEAYWITLQFVCPHQHQLYWSRTINDQVEWWGYEGGVIWVWIFYLGQCVLGEWVVGGGGLYGYFREQGLLVGVQEGLDPRPSSNNPRFYRCPRPPVSQNIINLPVS